MPVRNPINRNAGVTPIVDHFIGRAYPVVKKVADNLEKLVFISENMDNFKPHEVEFRFEPTTKYLQWRYVGTKDWMNLAFMLDMTTEQLTEMIDNMEELRQVLEPLQANMQELYDSTLVLKGQLETLVPQGQTAVGQLEDFVVEFQPAAQNMRDANDEAQNFLNQLAVLKGELETLKSYFDGLNPVSVGEHGELKFEDALVGVSLLGSKTAAEITNLNNATPAATYPRGSSLFRSTDSQLHLLSGSAFKPVAFMDASGHVVDSAGRPVEVAAPSLLLRRNDGQNTADRTHTGVIWQAATNAVAGMWVAGQPTRVTVPAGVTKIKFTIAFEFGDSEIGYRLMTLTKNGASGIVGGIGMMFPAAGDGNYTSFFATSAWLNVVQGDYFVVNAWQDSGGDLMLLGTSNTWLQAEIKYG